MHMKDTDEEKDHVALRYIFERVRSSQGGNGFDTVLPHNLLRRSAISSEKGPKLTIGDIDDLYTAAFP